MISTTNAGGVHCGGCFVVCAKHIRHAADTVLHSTGPSTPIQGDLLHLQMNADLSCMILCWLPGLPFFFTPLHGAGVCRSRTLLLFW